MSDWIKQITNNDEIILPPKGGTEILLEGMIKHSKYSQYDDINLLLSTPDYSKIRFTKKNILWQHLNYIDESLAPMKDYSFMKSIHSTVYVSHWQLEKFRYLFQVPLHNAHVIKNAIEPIQFEKKSKKEKIKLIYTSAPFRGLSVLLDVMDFIQRDDIELDVYSSTLTYGSNYDKKYYKKYQELFDRAKNTKNVNYIGYADNEKIRNALKQSHIFAYPSIFEETACLSMIEAAAAGCSLVTTDLGALPETGGMYAKMTPIKSNNKDLVYHYSKLLSEEINNYWSLSNQELLKRQSDYFNHFYSWEIRGKQWDRFFEEVSKS